MNDMMPTDARSARGVAPAIDAGGPTAAPSERIARALHLAVEGLFPLLGEKFFPALVRHLVGALQTRFAFVSELHESIPGRCRVNAFWDGTKVGACFEYDVKGTPCEQVLERGFAYHSFGVRTLFPQDSWLNGHGIEGYLAVALYDPSGQPIGHLGVMHDAPLLDGMSCVPLLKVFAARAGAEIDRRRAEAALHESEARYRGLVESQEELIVRFDMKGGITFVNEACCRFYEKAPSALHAQKFRALVFDEDVDLARAAIKRLEIPPHRARVDTRTPTPRGRRWVAWEGCAIRDEAGRTVEVQVVGRDVTDQHAAADNLLALVKTLRAREYKLRRLAGRLATIRDQERKRLGFDLHDGVCQELAGITIFLESLRRRLLPLPADTDATFDRLTHYLSRLGEHLRNLAHDLRPLQLEDLGLARSLGALAQAFSSAEHRVVAYVPTQVPRLSENVEIAIYRVAQEALTNALRHAAAREIVLKLSITDRRLLLEINDDGHGFDPSSHTASLGLLGMEERALGIGARLDIQSTVGKGTRISLRYPLPGSVP